MPQHGVCTQVSPECPASATTLGYAPNLGANVFFTVAYGICALFTIAIAVWKRTWAFGFTAGSGFILEMVGYIGRILLHYNAWNLSGFKMDLVCIIIAPTLICAGIYLTLKHVARTVAPTHSRITPRLYTWIFIPFDVFCLLLQAAGGVVDAAAADSSTMNESLLKTGDNIMIAGIALQVVNLIVFGLFSLDFWVASRKHFKGLAQKDSTSAEASAEARIWFSRRFRVFCAAVACAYAGILVRCVYRIAEMAGGWGNPVMQNEVLFYILEGAMVVYPAILLTIFAPGFFFPEMGTKPVQQSPTATDVDAGDVGEGEGEEYRMMTSEERIMSSE
ncbi:hypothetical protein UA08_04100 [Talaromyces atroroseus]|uniref:Sphingoid long-chain base transporter RSB1 n=1 Tax=Talaromyces atroroseus TaxID=1441469 RepID=A0A1Q5Q833_TALAT|nr:hypothetical protein UA08_04100 [Talaromyces atroroseus]OKL60274.1 hypothetical protein UA08_04100 [Talaromyces atroroseus]